MKKNILTFALTLISGLGMSSFRETPTLTTNAMPNIEEEAPIYRSKLARLNSLINVKPGGGVPNDARFIQYTFSIDRATIVYFQDFNQLYISIPYTPDQNNLTGLTINIENYEDDSVIYNHNLLSSQLLAHTGMTTIDAPMFTFKNIFNLDLMGNNYLDGDLIITINLPLNHFPPTWYNDMLNGTNFYSSLPKNDYAYQNGYTDGYTDGINQGYDIGHKDGFREGEASNINAWSFLTSIFTGFGGFFAIQLLPGVTIGGIAVLVMTLTLLPFLIGLFKGGKN